MGKEGVTKKSTDNDVPEEVLAIENARLNTKKETTKGKQHSGLIPPPAAVVGAEVDLLRKQVLNACIEDDAEPKALINAKAATNCGRLVGVGVSTTATRTGSSTSLSSSPGDVVEEMNGNHQRGSSNTFTTTTPRRPPLPRQVSTPGAFHVEGIRTGRRTCRSHSGSLTTGTMAAPADSFPDDVNSNDNVTLSAILVVSEEFAQTGSHHHDALNQQHRPSKRMSLILDVTPIEEDKGTESSCSRKTCWVGILCLGVVIAVGVTVVLLLVLTLSKNSGSAEEPASAKPVAPELALDEALQPIISYPPFRDDLVSDTLREMKDPESPSSKANAWMWGDPFLQDYPKGRQLQRFAMVSFFYAAGGSHWFQNDGWLSYEIHECDWFQVQPTSVEVPVCEESESTAGDGDDIKSRRLVSISLPKNGLLGTMTMNMQYLPHVRFVDVSHNALSGSPPPFSNATAALEVVFVQHNQFSGMLSAKSGFVPKNLRELDFSHNQLAGNSINSVAVMTTLQVLRGRGNQFRGVLNGAMFGAMENLTVLDIGDNLLSGHLPTEFSLLSNNLKQLDVSSNAFIGSIPEQWKSLRALEYLNVSDTFLTGAIPEDLCDRESSGSSLELVADCNVIECCVNR